MTKKIQEIPGNSRKLGQNTYFGHEFSNYVPTRCPNIKNGSKIPRYPISKGSSTIILHIYALSAQSTSQKRQSASVGTSCRVLHDIIFIFLDSISVKWNESKDYDRTLAGQVLGSPENAKGSHKRCYFFQEIPGNPK